MTQRALQMILDLSIHKNVLLVTPSLIVAHWLEGTILRELIENGLPSSVTVTYDHANREIEISNFSGRMVSIQICSVRDSWLINTTHRKVYTYHVFHHHLPRRAMPEDWMDTYPG